MFNLENPVWSAIGKLCDLVILNILFVVSCIPLFTIGASTTALYTVVRKIIHDEGSGVIKEFFKAFRSNFKHASLIWLILLPVGLLTLYEMYWMTLIKVSTLFILKYVFLILFIVWTMLVSYVFPVLGYFGNSVKWTLKSALIMCFYYLLPWTILIVALNALPWILFLVLSEQRLLLIQIMFWVGFAAIAGINSFAFDRISQNNRKQHGNGDEEYIDSL